MEELVIELLKEAEKIVDEIEKRRRKAFIEEGEVGKEGLIEIREKLKKIKTGGELKEKLMKRIEFMINNEDLKDEAKRIYNKYMEGMSKFYKLKDIVGKEEIRKIVKEFDPSIYLKPIEKYLEKEEVEKAKEMYKSMVG